MTKAQALEFAQGILPDGVPVRVLDATWYGDLPCCVTLEYPSRYSDRLRGRGSCTTREAVNKLIAKRGMPVAAYVTEYTYL